eukprot:6517589-Prymnesium_polylepis.1
MHAPGKYPRDADTWTRTGRGWSEYCHLCRCGSAPRATKHNPHHESCVKLMRSDPPISRHPSASHEDETHTLRRPRRVLRGAGVKTRPPS